MTQNALAALVDVEQGTVSRWERDIEIPRPASARKLRKLLTRDVENLVAVRQRAMVRQNLLPAGIYDKNSCLRLVSGLGRRYYRDRHALEIEASYGDTFQRILCEAGGEFAWRIIRDSGLLTGDALLVRIFVSSGGKNHLTHYEPIFDDGDFSGFVAYIVAQADGGPPDSEHRLRYADMLCPNPPYEVVELYSGPGAGVVKDLLL